MDSPTFWIYLTTKDHPNRNHTVADTGVGGPWNLKNHWICPRLLCYVGMSTSRPRYRNQAKEYSQYLRAQQIFNNLVLPKEYNLFYYSLWPVELIRVLDILWFDDPNRHKMYTLYRHQLWVIQVALILIRLGNRVQFGLLRSVTLNLLFRFSIRFNVNGLQELNRKEKSWILKISVLKTDYME